MTWNRVLRSLPVPHLEALLLFELCCPDCSTPGSTPAKAVIASRWVNLETSPIQENKVLWHRPMDDEAIKLLRAFFSHEKGANIINAS